MGGDTAEMTTRNAPLLDCLAGKVADVPPMWMMRQAGRYLPEYRALRADKGGFLELVYDSPAAAEITLQPLRRFEMDAAILFSDILIVPYAMGQNLQFLVGEGPHLSPKLIDHALESLVPVPERLNAIHGHLLAAAKFMKSSSVLRRSESASLTSMPQASSKARMKPG